MLLILTNWRKYSNFPQSLATNERLVQSFLLKNHADWEPGFVSKELVWFLKGQLSLENKEGICGSEKRCLYGVVLATFMKKGLYLTLRSLVTASFDWDSMIGASKEVTLVAFPMWGMKQML